MQTQEVSFTVTKQDYRAANYYIHFMSRTIFLYVSLGVLIAFMIYRTIVQYSALELWAPSVYITGAAVFWLLLQITKLEMTIRRYSKSSSNILGKKSILRYTDTRMTMKIPEIAFSSSGLFADYPAAFETRRSFLVYTSGTDLFLIPRRTFTKEKLEGFRNILIKAMGDRLASRYNKHAPHIPIAAEFEAEKIKQQQAEEKAAAREAAKAHRKAVREARKEGRDLPAEEAKAAEETNAAEEAGSVAEENAAEEAEAAAEANAAAEDSGRRPRRNPLANRANLVSSRGMNAEKKHE